MPPAYRTSDFAYELPPGLIAQEPIAERGASRLLLVDRATPDPARACTDLAFPDLVSLIPAGDLVVLNTTRVRHARFLATRPSGAPAEVLLIHPTQDDRWIAIGKENLMMHKKSVHSAFLYGATMLSIASAYPGANSQILSKEEYDAYMSNPDLPDVPEVKHETIGPWKALNASGVYRPRDMIVLFSKRRNRRHQRN